MAWSLVAYPLSQGPVVYAVERGWLPTSSEAAYRPVAWLLPPHRGYRWEGSCLGPIQVPADNPETRWYYGYVHWCWERGFWDRLGVGRLMREAEARDAEP